MAKKKPDDKLKEIRVIVTPTPSIDAEKAKVTDVNVLAPKVTKIGKVAVLKGK